MCCSICLKDILRGPFTLKCGHKFCTLCIFEWEKGFGNFCPLCRDNIEKIDNSPIWKINNMNKNIPKNSFEDLSENEINCIQNEFEIILTKLNVIPDDYEGKLAIVRENSVIFGTYNNDERKYIDNCVAIFRDNGVTFPCFPRKRYIEENIGFFYSINYI